MALDTTTLTAPAAGQTKREWLGTQKDTNGNALAKVGPGVRGRFSTDATAALAHAETQGWKFADPAPAAPATPKAQAVQRTTAAPLPAGTAAPATTEKPLPQVDPKEVRAWAKANGHEVAERGRLHKTVVQAFLAAGGKAVGPRASRPVAVALPKVRRETTGYSVVNGILVRQESCGNATNGVRHGIAQCTCQGGPRAYDFLEREAGQTIFLSLDKPADL